MPNFPITTWLQILGFIGGMFGGGWIVAGEIAKAQNAVKTVRRDLDKLERDVKDDLRDIKTDIKDNRKIILREIRKGRR